MSAGMSTEWIHRHADRHSPSRAQTHPRGEVRLRQVVVVIVVALVVVVIIVVIIVVVIVVVVFAGCCTRFLNRYGLSLCQRTKIAQKIPADLENKVGSFHKFLIDRHKHHAYDLSQIDETWMKKHG